MVKTNENIFYLFGDNTFKQCLVFDDNVKFVTKPTRFPISSKHPRKNVIIDAIHPGYKETRVVTRKKV